MDQNEKRCRENNEEDNTLVLCNEKDASCSAVFLFSSTYVEIMFSSIWWSSDPCECRIVGHWFPSVYGWDCVSPWFEWGADYWGDNFDVETSQTSARCSCLGLSLGQRWRPKRTEQQYEWTDPKNRSAKRRPYNQQSSLSLSDDSDRSLLDSNAKQNSTIVLSLDIVFYVDRTENHSWVNVRRVRREKKQLIGR